MCSASARTRHRVVKATTPTSATGICEIVTGDE
jgi:hypothetical protein